MLLIEGNRRHTRQQTQKNAFNFHSQYCPTPLLYRLFDPSLPMPGTTDMDFVDTFLAFRKEVLLLITTLCIIYVFKCSEPCTFKNHWAVPEKIHTPTTDGILEILAGGGSKILEIQVGGGVEHQKVFCRGNFD